LPRKVTERIALRFGKCVRSLQHFIGQRLWECEGLLKKQQALVVETLGEPDGVLLVDESGMVKQGANSVGVSRQYCGSVGKVANSQVGVYLGYASRKGHIFWTRVCFCRRSGSKKAIKICIKLVGYRKNWATEPSPK